MSKASDFIKRGMTDPDGGSNQGVAGMMAGGALKSAGSFVGVGGATGMSAVGAGGVAQNMAQVKPMKQKSSTSRNGNQNSKKPKAPQEVFDNTGYAGSDISDSQNTVSHKFRMQEEDGSSGMYDDYGIADVREEKDNVVYEYDYDANSNSFNAGAYNSGDQALKMQDMNKVFNSQVLSPEQRIRKSQYQSQGVQSVRQNANGRMEIHAKRGTGGIHGVGSANGMYHFQKRNGDNGSVNMLDAIEYAESQQNDTSNQ